MSLQTNKTLGGVGAVLIVLGVISSILTVTRYVIPNSAIFNAAITSISGVISVIALVGFILFFIAMYGISKVYNEHRIFDYVLYGIIIAIVAAIVATSVMFVFFFGNFMSMYPNLQATEQITSAMIAFMSPFIVVFGFIGLINIVFDVLALNLLAAKSQVNLFKTAAKVFLTGAIVQIVAGIVFVFWASFNTATVDAYSLVFVPGGVVQYIAWVILAKAFFKMPEPPTPIVSSSTGFSMQATGQIKSCPYCGAEISSDGVYCVRCGKKL